MNENSIKWNIRGYTKEDFEQAWFSSKTKTEIAQKLNLSNAGGNINTITKTAEILQLSSAHLDPYWNWRKENPNRALLTVRNIIPLEDILVKDSSYRNTHALKNKLYKSGLKLPKCEIIECGLELWLGKPAPLALDHINGKRSDNRIENLRILCYNCHGQTPTFSGKKMKKEIIIKPVTVKKRKTYSLQCACGKQMNRTAKNCLECSNKLRTKLASSYLPVQEMISGIEEFGYSKYSKQINLSDNGLRKVLRKLGVNPLPKKIAKNSSL